MTDTAIKEIAARRVWDSRGRPTVEVDVTLTSGSRGRAIAPAGVSTGSGEALELRDGGKAFGGLDVSKALASVRGEIAEALRGMDATDQKEIDKRLIELDGTSNRSRLGGNAIVATSMATLHAAATAAGEPLWYYLAQGARARIPLPEIQIFGGGAHAARRVDIQDFMVMCPAAESFSEALEWTAEIYSAAGSLMKKRGKLQGVADEGGYWPAFSTNEEALDTLIESVVLTGLKPGQDVVLSLDIAASEFGSNGRYVLALDGRTLDTGEMIDVLAGWLRQYPILSIEDPLAEDDHDGFRAFTAQFGGRCQIVGDDFLVTNAARVQTAAIAGTANAVLIKPNQAGTISESRAALDEARRAGFRTIVSARSGETEDTTIAHLSVGWDAGQLKVGSFSRSERMAKWNEVLRIEEAMGGDAVFSGWDALALNQGAQNQQRLASVK